MGIRQKADTKFEVKQPDASGLTGNIGEASSGDDLRPLDPTMLGISIGNRKHVDKMQIQNLISQVAREQNIDSNLLRAVVEAESDFNPFEVSNKGARGLMQLMPDTARELGVANPLDPYQNLTGGAKYLNQMLKRYQGNTELALAAYNAGPGNVDRAGGVPNFAETKNYVNKILRRIGTTP
jgi:soluble lytic murein transglycosylase-like protein